MPEWTIFLFFVIFFFLQELYAYEVWTVEKSRQNFCKMQQNWPYLILFIWYNIKKTEWAQKCAYQSCWKKKYYIMRQMENLAFIVIHHNE